jgi:two-component system nitrate/nitrite response regulator NarL
MDDPLDGILGASAVTDRQAAGAGDVTVLLGDAQVATRAGVRRALESQGIRVVAEAGSAEGCVAAALRYRPEVCLLAIHMPGNGIVAAEEISSALPDTRIIMLTGSDRAEDLFAALHAGADGYLLKTTSAERLPYAIRGVLAGEAALPRALAARLIDEYRNRGRRRSLPLSVSGRPVELTAREFEVLGRMRNGESTTRIAADLHISEVTVRRHISAIVHKVGAANRRRALALLEAAERSQLEGGLSA